MIPIGNWTCLRRSFYFLRSKNHSFTMSRLNNSPRVICCTIPSGFLKDALRTSLCLVRCTTAKFGETKSSLIKYVWFSCWTYLRETFHINRARQLTARTTVSWIYFQYRQKCSGCSCSKHKIVSAICLMKYQIIQFALFSWRKTTVF